MKVLFSIVVLLVFCSTSYGQAKSRTAFGLHQQFVQKRAIKGYKTNSAFQWKAQTYPGLVGANRSSGYWQDGRFHFYQQPQPTFYQQPVQNNYQPAGQTYYQQPVQTYYQQPAQTYYQQPVQTYQRW